MAFPDRITEIIDPLLLLQQEDGGFQQKDGTVLDSRIRIQECIASILRVGLSCSNELPKERMNTRSVAKELHSIRDDAFVGVGAVGERCNFASQT